MSAGRQLTRTTTTALAALLALAIVLCGIAPQGTLAKGSGSAGAPTPSLGLENGLYTIDLALEGGSGRASIESPARLEVYDGRAYVTIIWSSANYDYMKVDGRKYLPKDSKGNSRFEIPVDTIDEPLKVAADTTAMSKPHEIKYRIVFDRASLRREFKPGDYTIPIAVAVAIVMLAALVFAWSRQHARRISDEWGQ